MALTWAVDPATNDLILGEGTLFIKTGADEVQQRILIALQHQWREYFLNVPAGVPWYESILGSRNLRAAELLLRAAVLRVPGVLAIVRMVTTFGGRRFELQMDVRVAGGSGPARVMPVVYSVGG